jgi:hypothetical protein
VARSGVDGREHGAIIDAWGMNFRTCWRQALFLKRQLSLPVSMISQ